MIYLNRSNQKVQLFRLEADNYSDRMNCGNNMESLFDAKKYSTDEKKTIKTATWGGKIGNKTWNNFCHVIGRY